MRFAAAAIAFRARADTAFGVPFLRPPRLAWPILKLPRCGGRARPGLVPRENGLTAILISSLPLKNPRSCFALLIRFGRRGESSRFIYSASFNGLVLRIVGRAASRRRLTGF